MQLITGKTLHFLNSSYSHVERHRRREGVLFVAMNGLDAQSRGISDGQRVEVSNSLGTVEALCRISDSVATGVVWMPFGGLRDASDRPFSANTLTTAEATDWGGGGAFYDTLVEISPSRTRESVADH